MKATTRLTLCAAVAAMVLGHATLFAQGNSGGGGGGGGGGTTTYEVVRLAVPNAATRTTEAFNLNNLANVVGKYRDADDLPNGFHYNHATGMYTSLGLLVFAEGINQQDAIVGSDELAGRGLYWSSPTAASKSLAPLSIHTHSRAYAINDAGIIVGASYIPEDEAQTPGFRAVVAWYVNAAGTVSGPVELPFLAGDIAGRAFDLTEAVSGVTTVVGASGPAVSPLPVSWNVTVADGSLEVTGPAQFAGSYFLADAYGVNNHGDSVGRAAFAEGSAAEPFLARAGQSVVRLSLLSKADSGYATSINNAGRIVGFQSVYQKGQGMLRRAVMWTTSTTVIDLNSQVSLGRSEALEYASEINSLGDILARINGNTPCLLIAK